jgi:hypothetical protein
MENDEKRKAVAQAILEALRKDDTGAFVDTQGMDATETELSNITIDGTFDLLRIADAVMAAL